MSLELALDLGREAFFMTLILSAPILVVGLVVGLPLHASGDESELSRQAREFGEWLSRTVERPVTYWDERYTLSVAEEWLLDAGLSREDRKARRDKLAAQIILQSYLDRPRPGAVEAEEDGDEPPGDDAEPTD